MRTHVYVSPFLFFSFLIKQVQLQTISEDNLNTSLGNSSILLNNIEARNTLRNEYEGEKIESFLKK